VLVPDRSDYTAPGCAMRHERALVYRPQEPGCAADPAGQAIEHLDSSQVSGALGSRAAGPRITTRARQAFLGWANP
jgi:hypothetical protein